MISTNIIEKDHTYCPIHRCKWFHKYRLIMVNTRGTGSPPGCPGFSAPALERDVRHQLFPAPQPGISGNNALAGGQHKDLIFRVLKQPQITRMSPGQRCSARSATAGSKVRVDRLVLSLFTSSALPSWRRAFRRYSCGSCA